MRPKVTLASPIWRNIQAARSDTRPTPVPNQRTLCTVLDRFGDIGGDLRRIRRAVPPMLAPSTIGANGRCCGDTTQDGARVPGKGREAGGRQTGRPGAKGRRLIEVTAASRQNQPTYQAAADAAA